LEFADQWHRSIRPLTTLHGDVFVFGPLVIVGFPCLLGTEDYFMAPREPLPYAPEEWLMPLLSKYGPAVRTLWLMHEPPKGTVLSQSSGPLAGNLEWTEAVERFSPRLIVHGHDHDTPVKNKRWQCRIGDSTCVNVGQTDHGALHYALIKIEFTTLVPSLPTKMTVTAYPMAETVEIPH